MKNQEKIKKVYKEKVKKLLNFNQAYFEKDNPVVSDADFDKLKNELLKLSKKHPFLKQIENIDNLVGSKPSTKFEKIKHTKPMLSHINVGSGDEISISIWGYSEFSETLVVDERGYINPSSYGRIYVKGLTFKKMRSLLKSRFSTFLDMKNSEIDVTLSYSRVITVNIVGEVYLPGSYTIPAINTAFNALIFKLGYIGNEMFISA